MLAFNAAGMPGLCTSHFTVLDSHDVASNYVCSVEYVGKTME
jgi:hypothetical protein